MKIRPATTDDEQALRGLWEEFEAEVPEPAGFQPDTWADDWSDMSANIETGAVFIAEDDDGPAGFAEARAAEPGRWHLDTVYVRPRARRQGVAKALLAAVRQGGRRERRHARLAGGRERQPARRWRSGPGWDSSRSKL